MLRFSLGSIRLERLVFCFFHVEERAEVNEQAAFDRYYKDKKVPLK
jgi:hypothetical protein